MGATASRLLAFGGDDTSRTNVLTSFLAHSLVNHGAYAFLRMQGASKGIEAHRVRSRFPLYVSSLLHALSTSVYAIKMARQEPNERNVVGE